MRRLRYIPDGGALVEVTCRTGTKEETAVDWSWFSVFGCLFAKRLAPRPPGAGHPDGAADRPDRRRQHDEGPGAGEGRGRQGPLRRQADRPPRLLRRADA